ncbi:glycosyltransferase [Glaesserella parasuis]|uniref:glycosyltransferase n=1 Tax=Glaesserella parasuis TaxID=738 RepID=UPI003854A6DA
MDKKILIVSPALVYGGGETYLLQLNNILNQLGFITEFIVSNERLFTNLECNNKRLIVAKTQHIAALKSIFLIRKILKENQYDFVILNGLSEIGVFSNFIPHDKIIVIGHSNEEWLTYKPYHRGILHALKRVVSYRFDKKLFLFVALNDITVSNTRLYGDLYKKTVKIYTGIEEINIVNESDPNIISFGRIGRLIEKKGNRNLIKAFSFIHKVYPNTKLVFAGDGYKRKKLEQLAKDLGISHSVMFMGVVNPRQFYSKIDCMISPSLSEAFPIILLEAMSSRVPIISTSVGGCTEILVDGKTGRLVSPNSVLELQEAMVDYIQNKEVYKKFSEEAYGVYLSKFSMCSFLKQWEKVLKS